MVQIAREYVEGGWQKILKEAIPTVAGLSVVLGVSRETIYAWADQDDKREFSDVVAELQSIQERVLLSHGLFGNYNSTIAKLILSSKHGYAERTEHTGADGTPLVDLTKALKEIIKRQ